MICIQKKLSIALLAAALAGCVTGQPLREIAVDSNRLAARTADEQTMLNILRAKDRMPMHFTSFTLLRGSISVGGNVGVGASFPDGALETATGPAGVVATTTKRAIETVSPSIGATMISNPSFEMAVFDTQEFQRGILTPVDERIVEYYLAQGWPEDLLTALFVNHLEVSYGNKTAIWRNHPVEDTLSVYDRGTGTTDELKGFRFDQLLTGTSLTSISRQGTINPLIGVKAVSDKLDIEQLALLDGKKLDVVEDPAMGRSIARITGAKRGIDLRFNSPDATGLMERLRKAVGAPTEAKFIQSAETDAPCQSSSQTGECVNMRIFLRAPEGILYFLGSYVRYDVDNRGVYNLPGDSEGERPELIHMMQGNVAGSLLTVRYRDQVWSLPDPARADAQNPSHRGSQAITLVQQLVNLQKKAEDIPTSSAVRIIAN